MTTELFFVGNDSTDGNQLWASDGTSKGTVMLTDINPGNGGLSFSGDLIIINGTSFFFANDSANGWQLWRSDGTASGTIMVTDINPTGGGLTCHGHQSNKRRLESFHRGRCRRKAVLRRPNPH